MMLVWRCASTARLYVQTANVGDSSCALGRVGEPSALEKKDAARQGVH